MTNFNIRGDNTAEKELEKNTNIQTGDTITYHGTHQEEFLQYKVVEGYEGEKTLKLVDSYAHQNGDYDINKNNDYNTDNEDSDSDDSQSGGKKRKTNRRKTNRRKTNRRKTNRRKTNRRKTNRRKTNRRKR